MKELLFALSIYGSFLLGFTAIAKLCKNKSVAPGHMLIWSAFVTAMITHLLGMW